VAERARAGDALARYYDLDLDEDPGDIDLYLALAAAVEGPVLELMAGSGRVAVPLARAGHDVVAVDRDPAMLARAAAYWQRVKDRAPNSGKLELVERDLGKYKSKSGFGLVIVALNSLLLLDGRAAQREALKVIGRSLALNGRAVIDVWLPAPEDLALYDGRLVLDWVRRDEANGTIVSKTTAARYDSATRTAYVTSFFDEWRATNSPTRTIRQDTVTLVSVDELEQYARDAGLIVDTIGGDYEMGHFAPDSERVVMVLLRTGR
jgi:SAM-dependent methyltransferase